MKKFQIIGFFVFAINVLASTTFALSLGTAGDYNAFIFGDFTSANSDTQGRLAAGGDVSLTNYGVGDALPSDTSGTTNTLVAGGDLTYSNGQVNNGNAVAGGSAAVSNVNVPDGALTWDAIVPIDFEAERSYLLNLSSQLAFMTSTGTVQYESWGGIYFTGDGTSMLQVFEIDGTALSSANTFAFLDATANIPENATVVFNISGISDSMQNFDMSAFAAALGSSYDNVLFNFYEATSLMLSGISINGSILAPLADVTAENGSINGTIIANLFKGSMQLNYVPFEETTTVPEPGTVILLTTGIFGLAGVRRRLKK